VKQTEASFTSQTIVFTGFRNKDWENYVLKHGGKVTSTVSKNTTLVVAANVNDTSAKVMKAKELSIPLMSKEEFEKQFNMK